MSGREFDSTYKRARPATFTPGQNNLLKGFKEALRHMQEGDKWEIVLPPELGFGAKGKGRLVPRDAVLKFEITLVKIQLGLDGWDGDNGNIIHVDDEWLKKLDNSKQRYLLLFHVPWCPHCKALRSEYAQLSRRHSDVAILALDCKSHPIICRKKAVDSYPTIVYYQDELQSSAGARKRKEGDFTYKKSMVYKGSRTYDDLSHWLKRRLRGEILVDDAKKQNYFQHNVRHLTKQNFDYFLSNHGLALIMFYSPKCSHSQSLIPHYGEVAHIIESRKETHALPFAAIDCLAEFSVCSGLAITGFPTVSLFRKGVDQGNTASLKPVAMYNGPKNAEYLLKWSLNVLATHSIGKTDL